MTDTTLLRLAIAIHRARPTEQSLAALLRAQRMHAERRNP